MKKPKEDPEDRKARIRERNIATAERLDAAQQSAASLGNDLRSAFGFTGFTGQASSLGNSSGMFTVSTKPTAVRAQERKGRAP